MPPRPEPVTLRGLERTRPETVLELLPRAPPAHYTEAELVQFPRRLPNLGIFDHAPLERTPPGIARA